jgi:hypothetical protein
MSILHTLRHAHQLAKLVLVWFVLSMGVAIASPLVQPQSFELICSGTGAMKLLVKSDDGTAAQASHGLHCAMCVQASAPPPVLRLTAEPPGPLAYATQALPAAIIAAQTAAPPPARGPPSV